VIPDIPGLQGTPYLTSTEALRLTEKPKSIIIFGGGYIACELGFYFAGLGVETHILARSSLLKNLDGDVHTEFNRVFSEGPVKIHYGIKEPSVTYDQDTTEHFGVTYNKADGMAVSLNAEHLLICTGITPNSDTLDCAAGGVELREDGYIKVDEFLRTTAPGVWALGDIAGNYAFRHSANYEGDYLRSSIFLDGNTWDNPGVPIDYSIGVPGLSSLLPKWQVLEKQKRSSKPGVCHMLLA